MASEISSQGSKFPEVARVVNGSGGRVWHKTAPQPVRRASAADWPPDGWSAWQQHLARRRRPAAAAELLPGDGGGLDWGLPGGTSGPPTPKWLDDIEHGFLVSEGPDAEIEKEVLRWLGESAGLPGDVDFALEALAVADALPRLAAVLSADAWWSLLEHLLVTSTEAGGSEADDRPLEENPLLHQLLAGELALKLAYLFPEITSCRKLKSLARRALSAGPVDLLDGEGLPHAKNFPLLRPLLACWTRCRAVGERMKGGCWRKAAQEQYEWLVRQALRLSRADGSPVLAGGSPGRWDPELFAAALQFGGNEDDEQIAALVLPKPWTAAARPDGEKALPEPANHSEWAAVGVLRRCWGRRSEQLTVLYDRPAMQIELGCGSDVVLSGTWQWEVRRDGELLSPTGEWEEVCWISDDDVDYLELEIDLAGEVQVQRSILMARSDRFALLADAVLGEQPGKIEYRSLLPLGPGIAFEGAKQSREGLLVGSKRRAQLLPLALPEWRRDKRIGELQQTSDGLQLQQAAEGRRLFAPLLLDLHRGRHRRKLTWRQLTVAQSLQIQPPEVAVGYRVALGKQQWLIYRSLAKRANRTLLGHNLSTEMVVGRFDRQGEVAELLEIE